MTTFKRLHVRHEDPNAFGYAPGGVRCKHAMKDGPGRTTDPHSDACGRRIAEALRGTDAGRRRIDEFEKRTNQEIAPGIQRNQDNTTLGAPVAQGEIGR